MSVTRIETVLPDLVLLEPTAHGDERGFLLESFREGLWAKHGVTDPFVQENHSRSSKGILRGIHFQTSPGQAKLVRCVRGAIWDCGVDLRPGSATYLGWHGVELSADNRRGLYLPAGFAHGFQTLTADCEVQYLMGHVYVPDAARGVRWDDPAIGIEWPEPHGTRTMSDKDRGYPDLVP